ncbi:Choline acetyltransferase [Operophtera brumata]|uniref:Choline O-acetyltransferase n=1 Tax=Operophtera brumata TaxID=104452 RepID=A0A0L7LEC0_OPEBR|nr:Choline acetyltransferase [Operophtera brumata]
MMTPLAQRKIMINKNRMQQTSLFSPFSRSNRRHSYMKPTRIHIPVTSMPRQLLLKQKFQSQSSKYFRPKPILLQSDDDFYSEKFKLRHHPINGLTWKEKVGFVQDALRNQFTLPEKQNVIERPSYVEKPKFLRDRVDSVRNYVSDYVRLPLPINSNPGMVFPRRHFAKMEEVADLGALFIDDLLDYKEMLDRGELPLERATSREKGQPLCMEQFYRLLGVCRIPEVGRDRLELPLVKSDPEEYEELVVVACRNHFYPIPVKAADRGRLTPGEIQGQILHCMIDAASAAAAPRVGLLTSMQRDSWARARETLIKDENNRTNLELISRALCILCLDESGGDRADTDEDTNGLLRAMHGAGTRYHSANRWFDKTVQLIISQDGTIGMCYEHSAAEGVAVVRLAERALARAEVADRPAPPPALLPAPQAMKWNILPDVMYGYLVSTYESASLRRFRNGRVDNIRSAHAAAHAWAAAMCTAESSPLNQPDDGQKKVSFNLYGEQKKLELFEEAARKQTEIMEANILGRGIDNHLLGLREMARETLGELPPIFTDDTYKQMIDYKLSTSQVSTTTDGTFMGYGAVIPDGYGCSYNPKRETVIFCIASFTSSSVTNTEAFRQSLEEALDSMKLMFQARKVEA